MGPSQRVRRRVIALGAAFAAAAGTIAIVAPPVGAAQPPQPKPVLGEPPAGVGLGSKAALAQANCDPERKRTNYATVGGGPFCVNPWKDGKSNGGATAPGVTATSVKVLVLTPNSEQEAAQRSRGGSLPVNQVTGERGTWEDAFRDFNTVASKSGAYQTWGRTVELEFQQSSGSDEAAQRADAIAVAAKKPFIVIDATDQSLGHAGVRVGGREEQDHRERRRDHHGSVAAAGAVPLEHRPGQHRRRLHRRRVHRQDAVEEEGAVGGLAGSAEADPELRRRLRAERRRRRSLQQGGHRSGAAPRRRSSCRTTPPTRRSTRKRRAR